jgi:hypothetical protein
MRSSPASARLRQLVAFVALVALGPSVAEALTTLRWEQLALSPPVDEFRVYTGASTDQGEVVWAGLPSSVPSPEGEIYTTDVQIDEIDQGVPVYVWLTAVNAFGESPPSNANFYPGCDPLLDSDCDTVADADDNCPYAPNAGQEDTGGIGAVSAPDGIGDECQCGDVDGDRRVTSADGVRIMRSLLVPPVPLTRPELCNVDLAPACNSADAVTVLRAQLTPPAATIQQQCDPALP